MSGNSRNLENNDAQYTPATRNRNEPPESPIDPDLEENFMMQKYKSQPQKEGPYDAIGSYRPLGGMSAPSANV